MCSWENNRSQRWDTFTNQSQDFTNLFCLKVRISVAYRYSSLTLLEKALSLRPQPTRDRMQSWWAQFGSPGSLSYNFQQDFTKCPPPQLIVLCNVAKCETLSKEMGISCYCGRMEMLKTGKAAEWSVMSEIHSATCDLRKHDYFRETGCHYGFTVIRCFDSCWV